MLWGTLKQTWSIAATDGRLPGLGSCCTALIVRLIDRSACGATDGLPLVLSCRADGTRITQAGNTHPSFARKPNGPEGAPRSACTTECNRQPIACSSDNSNAAIT